MPDTQELAPCPFCGEAPETMVRPNNADSSQFFACVVCYCNGYSSTAHKSASRPTAPEAAAAAATAWNTRAALAAAPAEQASAALTWDVAMPPEVAEWLSANPPKELRQAPAEQAYVPMTLEEIGAIAKAAGCSEADDGALVCRLVSAVEAEVLRRIGK
jgi:Lar family restriction alleviation protein